MTDDQPQPCEPPPCPSFQDAEMVILPPSVTLGARVHYRGKLGRQTVRAADVTCTVDHLDPAGVQAGDIPALSSPVHVHLNVLTPSDLGHFTEYDVPFSDTLEPGTWRWPDMHIAEGWWMQRYYAWLRHAVVGDVVDVQADDHEPTGAGCCDPGPHLHNPTAGEPPVQQTAWCQCFDPSKHAPLTSEEIDAVLATLSADHVKVLKILYPREPDHGAPGKALTQISTETGIPVDEIGQIIDDLTQADLVQTWPEGSSRPIVALRIDPSEHAHPSGDAPAVTPG